MFLSSFFTSRLIAKIIMKKVTINKGKKLENLIFNLYIPSISFRE